MPDQAQGFCQNWILLKNLPKILSLEFGKPCNKAVFSLQPLFLNCVPINGFFTEWHHLALYSAVVHFGKEHGINFHCTLLGHDKAEPRLYCKLADLFIGKFVGPVSKMI